MNATTVRDLRAVRPEMEYQRTGQDQQKRVCVPAMQRRREKRRARKAKAFAAITVLWAVEVLLSVIAGAVAAAILIPLALLERGYFAFGGEWLIVFITTAVAYHCIHKAVFKWLES